MIQILICDDEQVYIDEIEKNIKEFFPVGEEYSIDKENSGEGALSLLSGGYIPDIVFMDIEMDGVNGLDAVKEIKQTKPQCIVFFVTSHSNYIADIFRLGTFQFLQKPINVKDFEIDLNRAVQAYRNNHMKIEIKSKNEIREIEYAEIRYIEVFRHNIKVHLKGEALEQRGRISDFEKLLIGRGFVKTHKSFLVNMLYIRKITNESVILDGEEFAIPLSRNCRSSFFEEWSRYQKEVCL